MSAQKPSKTKQPKFGGHTIFLDRTHGKAMGAALRRVGFKVKSIWTVYRDKAHESTDDTIWIKRCVQEGWVPITGDKKIEDNPVNRNAVIESKAKIFMLTDSNSHPEEWSAAVMVGADRIRSYFECREGPFFVDISKQSHSHVGRFRNPADEASRKQAVAQQSHEQRKENQSSATHVRGSNVRHSESEAPKEGKEAGFAAESESAQKHDAPNA